MNNKIGRREFLGTAALVGVVAAAGQGSLVNSAAAASEAGDGIISASAVTVERSEWTTRTGTSAARPKAAGQSAG